jgi:SAM-dependent methyltransferase
MNVQAAAVADLDEWCTVGARDKALSVVSLARGHGVRDVIEIGCGTGPLLAQLDQFGFAERYWGCEPMAALCAQVRQKRIERLVEVDCTTFEDGTFGGRRFDLAILSHVLEHVLNPGQLLGRALDRATYVLVEVPIEANVSGNVRAAVRRRLRGKPRTTNDAGHIQFFSVGDLRKLARWSGGEILAQRLYFPSEVYRAMRASNRGVRRAYLDGIAIGERLLGNRALARLYYGHCAVLLRRRVGFEAEWGHPLFWRPEGTRST